MIVILTLALGYAAGVDVRRLALLAATVHLPVVVGVLIAIHWYRARPDHGFEPALFCEGVASELRAGASLRDAVVTAAASVSGVSPSTLATAGSSMSEVAARLGEAMPSIARELEHTVVAAARSGSDAAALFDEIGSLAIAQTEIGREVRVATAPGRATALVLVGAPAFYLASQMGSGGLAEHLSTPEQRVVALVGLGLFLVGLGLSCLVLWRASR